MIMVHFGATQEKGHRLLSVEHERTEGRPENDLVAGLHQVIVPEQPDQALEG